MTKRLEREEARRLRAGGASIVAIARDLQVARSSVSVWVRDIRPAASRTAPTPSAFDVRTTEGDGSCRRCGRCGHDLPLAAFARLRDGRQHWCRECFREYQGRRRVLNDVQRAAATARRRARARAQVVLHLDGEHCVDCGDPDIVVLEFDHVRGPKERRIADLVHAGASQEVLAAEIAKCDVVCVSCHRVRTASRAGTYSILGEGCTSWPQKSPSQRRAMRFVGRVLASRCCVDCGEVRAACLDFDHLRDKLTNIAELVCDGASDDRLETEISKCVVRCAKCHRRRTEWGRRSWKTRLPGAVPPGAAPYG